MICPHCSKPLPPLRILSDAQRRKAIERTKRWREARKTAAESEPHEPH